MRNSVFFVILISIIWVPGCTRFLSDGLNGIVSNSHLHATQSDIDLNDYDIDRLLAQPTEKQINNGLKPVESMVENRSELIADEEPEKDNKQTKKETSEDSMPVNMVRLKPTKSESTNHQLSNKLLNPINRPMTNGSVGNSPATIPVKKVTEKQNWTLNQSPNDFVPTTPISELDRPAEYVTADLPGQNHSLKPLNPRWPDATMGILPTISIPVNLSPPFANHPEFELCDYSGCMEQLDSTYPTPPDADTGDHSPDVVVRKETSQDATPLSPTDHLDRAIQLLASPADHQDGHLANSDETISILKSLRQRIQNGKTQSLLGEPNLASYWQEQVAALKFMTEPDLAGDVKRSSITEAIHHLRKATDHLMQSADLKLRSACFCSKVVGFGQFREFEEPIFHPSQPVLVYCEIENFVPVISKVEATDSFETRIASSYWIRDNTGTIVQSQDYPEVSDLARKIRHDFFMHVPVQFQNLAPGNYQLQVEVIDGGSGKSAQLESPLNFSIR